MVFPKPQMEKYEFSDKPLSVFTGDFDLTAKFKVPAAASQGPGIMLGKLRYQACNNNSCFPPKNGGRAAFVSGAIAAPLRPIGMQW